MHVWLDRVEIKYIIDLYILYKMMTSQPGPITDSMSLVWIVPIENKYLLNGQYLYVHWLSVFIIKFIFVVRFHCKQLFPWYLNIVNHYLVKKTG